MIRCPACNEMTFSRVSYDKWLCTFCNFDKNNRNQKIQLRSDPIG